MISIIAALASRLGTGKALTAVILAITLIGSIAATIITIWMLGTWHGRALCAAETAAAETAAAEAATAEVARQGQANDIALRAAEARSAVIQQQASARERALQEAIIDAQADPHSGACGLDADGVRRIRSISSGPAGTR